MRLARPVLEAGFHVVRSVIAQSRMASNARYDHAHRQFLARTSDRTRFVTTGVGKRSNTEEKEVGFKERP